VTTQADLARRLRTLHAQPPLVLPNAWDAGSARAIEAAGAAAIATTSAGVSWAAGVEDAGGLNRTTAIAALRAICAAVSVPVTADIEARLGILAAVEHDVACSNFPRERSNGPQAPGTRTPRRAAMRRQRRARTGRPLRPRRTPWLGRSASGTSRVAHAGPSAVGLGR
jgi:hypothetical protein